MLVSLPLKFILLYYSFNAQSGENMRNQQNLRNTIDHLKRNNIESSYISETYSVTQQLSMEFLYTLIN